MQSERVILTYEDYAELPDDGRRYEIHEGELSMNPAPSPRHQEVSRDLGDVLWPHIKAYGLGQLYYAPIDCILDESTIVQPDLVFVETSNLGQISNRGIEGAPTLVIEIISPSTRRIDRIRKSQLYAKFGVPYYWIVDPEPRTIQAFRLAEGHYLRAGELAGSAPISLPPFPDLRLDPASIWP